MSHQPAMMHASPPLDMVDAVFLRRLHHRPSRESSSAAVADHQVVESATTTAEVMADAPASPKPLEPSHRSQEERKLLLAVAAAASSGSRSDTVASDQPLVEWLLQKAAHQWAALAVAVERAVADGLRVIAVAGGGRGEGRTTLVEGLAATLTARGWHVVLVSGPLSEAGEAVIGGDRHRELVLVDAGVWFPPGPIRRERVAAMSAGCDAVILVRRATQAPSPARAAAIEQAGCRLLGEVETLVPWKTFEELHRHADT